MKLMRLPRTPRSQLGFAKLNTSLCNLSSSQWNEPMDLLLLKHDARTSAEIDILGKFVFIVFILSIDLEIQI